MTRETALLVSMLIHVPIAVAWIAFAAIDLAVIAMPGIANGQRARLIGALRWPTIAFVLVILLTGTWQTIDNPFQTVTNWETLEKLRETTTYGTALFVKHIFVVGTFALSLWIRFSLAPRLDAPSTASSTERPRGLLPLAVWLNVAMCVAVILATTRMTIQLH